MNEIIVDDTTLMFPGNWHDALNLAEDPLYPIDVLKEKQQCWKRILIIDDVTRQMSL
jgi:hypothetical protein